MDTQVWSKIEDKQGVVLALTGDTLYRMEFSGKDAKREATEAVTAVRGGQSPADLVLGSKKVVPVSAIQRVEVSHGRDTVKFFTVEGDKPVKVEFTIQSSDDAPAIARAVVERAKIEHPERSEDIGVVEALTGPVILAVIAGVFWGFVYAAATTMDSGEEIETTGGSSRSRGIKRLVVFIAQILGTNGTIAVGVILAIAFIGWAARLIVKRPQRMVWGPPATA